MARKTWQTFSTACGKSSAALPEMNTTQKEMESAGSVGLNGSNDDIATYLPRDDEQTSGQTEKQQNRTATSNSEKEGAGALFPRPRASSGESNGHRDIYKVLVDGAVTAVKKWFGKSHSLKTDVQILCKYQNSALVDSLLQELSAKLREHGIDVQKKQEHFLCIVCLHGSRLFEDASDAIKNKPERKAALLIFHLRDVDSPPLYPSKNLLRAPEFERLDGIVDFLITFTPDLMIYDCQENEDSFKELQKLIQKFEKRDDDNSENLSPDQKDDMGTYLGTVSKSVRSGTEESRNQDNTNL